VNWIAKSSQQLEHKLPSVPYRDQLLSLSGRVRRLLTAHSGCIGLLFLLLLSAWAASNWFLAVQKMVRYYNPLPVWDYWNVVQHLQKYRALDFRVLWQQHNEHRIIFPEIVFALDMLLAHGCQILPLALSFMCYFCTWVVMSWTIFSDGSLSPAIRWAAILLAGIIIGWQGSTIALGIPFLLQWTLTQLAAVLAFALLHRLKHTTRSIDLVGTIVCATVATYSSGNGLLLWPLIIAGGILLSLGRSYMLALVIAGIANISLYFIHYHLGRGMDLMNLVRHPIYLLGFLSSYVSMPFGMIGQPQFGVWLGISNLLLFIALLAIAARRRLLHCGPSIVFFGCFAFTLLTALLTAAGRMNPQDSSFTAAKASRYITLPLVNWGALAMALIWLCAKCRWRLAPPANIACFVTVLLLVTFPKLKPRLVGNDVFFARQQWATLSIESGLFDPEIERYIYPAPAFIKPLLRQLRDNRLSVFFKGYTPWLGDPVSSRLSGPFTSRASGAVTRILPIQDGVEVIGWAEGSRSQRLVFVNESRNIVGFGRKLLAGFPYDLQSPETPTSLGWVGFVNSSFENKSFFTYLIDRRTGRITPIGGRSAIPTARPVAPTDAGPLISGLAWQMDPSWTVNGIPRASQLSTSPIRLLYGTWTDEDHNTGRITSSDFSAPANSCIILPVLHGRSVNGLSVDIVDADTNRVLESAPMQDVDIHWRFWRFLPTPRAKRLRITAEDQGQDSGQWLAIGQPSQCR
jgi:hypothetical protein